MSEVNDGQMKRKATLQHFSTIFVKRTSGESVGEIARSLKMDEKSVRRDLLWLKEHWLAAWHREDKDQTADPAPSDLLPKTSCTGCNKTIEAREYRVDVMIREVCSDDEDGRAQLGSVRLQSFCDNCVEGLVTFELPNHLRLAVKATQDWVLEPSPPSEDAVHRSVTGRGGKEKGNGLTAHMDLDDDGRGQAGKEEIEFSEHVGPGQAAIKVDLLRVRTGESIRKETLAKACCKTSDFSNSVG
jgi:hypothetical protein